MLADACRPAEPTQEKRLPLTQHKKRWPIKTTSLQAYVSLQLQHLRNKLHSGTLCCLCSSACTTRCSTPAAASPCRSMLTPRPSTAAWLSRTACLSSCARLHRSGSLRSAGSGLSASMPVEVRRSPPSMSIASDMLWRQGRTVFLCYLAVCPLHALSMVMLVYYTCPIQALAKTSLAN